MGAQFLKILSFRNKLKKSTKKATTPPPLRMGEYDADLPLTPAGFMINIGEIEGCAAFISYRSFPTDGTPGPAEKEALIHNAGDKIVSINGTSTSDKSFREVIMILAESRAKGMASIRFQESRYAFPGIRLFDVLECRQYDELMQAWTGEDFTLSSCPYILSLAGKQFCGLRAVYHLVKERPDIFQQAQS